MRGWGLFFFLLFLLLIFAAIGYVVFTQMRARRAGLPPPTMKSYIPFMHSSSGASVLPSYPTPRSSGPIEWIKDQFDKLRDKRTARGAYEETGSGGGLEGAGLASYGNSGGAGSGGRRGRGMEDETWDDRVGNEDGYAGAFYEEQELGLAPTPGLQSESYGGGGSGYMGAPPTYAGGDRGRSKSREPPVSGSHLNPFGDQNEAASMRSVSPRPESDRKVPAATAGAVAPSSSSQHVKDKSSLDSNQDTTGNSPTSRRSMFREEV